MKKNILAIQMHSEIGNISANFEKVRRMVGSFFEKSTIKPDIMILPEVWTTGWLCGIFGDLAEENGQTEAFLSDLAKSYNVNIIGGSYIKKAEGVCKNTCPCFDRKGKLIARYEKIHLYAPDGEAEFVSPGEEPVLIDIEGLRIGLSICYDIRFPELFRSYINTEFPPELLINMSAWPLTRKAQYQAMAQSRAIENQCYFLALSQTGLIKDEIYNAGNSLFVEPMGEISHQLDKEEGYIFSNIDTQTVLDVRKTYPNLKNRKVFDFKFKPKMCGVFSNV